MRKQNKRDVSRASLGNEEDFINPTAPSNNKAHNNQDDEQHHFHQSHHHHSPTVRNFHFFTHYLRRKSDMRSMWCRL
ncbi:hypothetical protein WN943_023683 [Citrus x changshan-huyou]